MKQNQIILLSISSVMVISGIGYVVYRKRNNLPVFKFYDNLKRSATGLGNTQVKYEESNVKSVPDSAKKAIQSLNTEDKLTSTQASILSKDLGVDAKEIEGTRMKKIVELAERLHKSTNGKPFEQIDPRGYGSGFDSIGTNPKELGIFINVYKSLG